MADDGLNYKYNPTAEGLKLCASTKYIYILLTDSDINGKKANSFNDSGFGNTIEVYDWDGNLQNKYELDSFIGGITLNSKGKELIASTYDPETFSPKFIKYPID